ncbi:hypothetical protein CYMTET_9836 [Cymbomonas tetramitiformis]|uniref:Phospholipase/carboxylesterase/thioesterase domain-containing protein n=1 Tax=Cymbomonas tetramitiformis TaxID=36881 RepID=A0AAE0LF30_9CHLO|nr:hypothetical protein CYMTET_9836 [Cymbomonas tetramitiformis]
MAYTFGATVTRAPRGNPSAAVIFLHGLGDTGNGWAPVVDSGALKVKDYAKFVFPTAPTQAVKLNGGAMMPAWFDLPGNLAEMLTNIDWKGVNASIGYLHSLIDTEISNGIPSDRIVVGGFSQGGCIAMRAALKYPKPLGGLCLASTFLGPDQQVEIADCNSKIPTLWCHGEADPMVPLLFAQMGVSALQSKGIPLELKTYPGLGHSASPEELAKMDEFLTTRLPQAPATPPPTSEEVSKMSVKELKTYLGSKNINFAGCFEKTDLVSLALSSL